MTFEEAVAKKGLSLPEGYYTKLQEKEKAMETTKNSVYRTNNYKLFKYLDGNRNVEMTRVKKVVDSITNNGYILNPIVVNEKMEIIDGQARRVALEQLNMPIDYVVAYGAGVKECIALNKYSTSWGVANYINSHADLGEISYIYFRELMKEYSGKFNINTIYLAIKNKCRAGGKADELMNGTFSCSQEEYEMARRTLDSFEPIRKIINNIPGTNFLYMALVWMTRRDEVDKKRLLDRVFTRQGDLRPVVSCEDAIDVLSNIYNFGLKKKLLYLSVAYKEEKDRAMCGLYTRKGYGRKA